SWYEKLTNSANLPEDQANLARFLATCPDRAFREPPRAVRLAESAVAAMPQEASHWNTLGLARYRAGNWSGAVAALEKSVQLSGGGDGADFFFLAMARWQLGDKGQAPKWYEQGIRAMEKRQNAELRGFRAEAGKLLGIKEPER